MSKGLVHIYTGDGKGKTTSAIGVAVRCAGHGKKVCIYQFLKAMPTGEIESLTRLDIDVVRVNSSDKFYPFMTDDEKRITREEINKALQTLFVKPCDLIIMDEIICAVDLRIVNIKTLTDIIKNKPRHTELIMTGRNMPEELLEYTDYVSEIKCIKHPYDNGINARCGIDF